MEILINKGVREFVIPSSFYLTNAPINDEYLSLSRVGGRGGGVGSGRESKTIQLSEGSKVTILK